MESADPARGPEQENDGRRASGQRETLLELLSILAHDLNNPLQTMLVLSELALDESPPGTDAHDRAVQCLAAADRLKTLTQAMGSVLRGRPQDAGQLWTRSVVMLGRRLERYGVVVEAELGVLDGVALAVDAEWALLTATLSVIASAAASSRRRHELTARGELGRGGAVLVLGLIGIEPDGTRTPVPFEPRALARLVDVVEGASVDPDGHHVRLTLAPRA